jgi:hypothetical protein
VDTALPSRQKAAPIPIAPYQNSAPEEIGALLIDQVPRAIENAKKCGTSCQP